MQEARDLRQKQLFQLLVRQIGFCALYRVPEHIWKTGLPPVYDRTNTRAMHPGLSLSGPRFSLDAVPMLHGTTPKKEFCTHSYSVVIKGILKSDPEHETAFGHLLAPIPLHAWQGKDSVEPLRDARRLTRDEKHEIATLARRKGWL